MKRLILAFFSPFLLFAFVFSQDKQPSNIFFPRPSDEFIPVNCEDAMARLDSYAIQLHNEPDAKAYIVFYDGKITRYTKKFLPSIGEARRITNDLIGYLVRYRGIEKDRFIIVNGGNLEEFFVELWTVPAGQPLPQPKQLHFSLKKIQYRKRGLPRLCSEIIAL